MAFVNDERLILDHLRADPGVSAIAGARVRTSVPGPEEASQLPCVVLSRIAGGSDYPGHLDRPRVQIEAWAERGQRPVAAQLMRAIRVAMSHEVIEGPHALGVVASSDEENVLYLVDQPTSRPRYVGDFRVVIHP